jgi:hypothetical protein
LLAFTQSFIAAIHRTLLYTLISTYININMYLPINDTILIIPRVLVTPVPRNSTILPTNTTTHRPSPSPTRSTDDGSFWRTQNFLIFLPLIFFVIVCLGMFLSCACGPPRSSSQPGTDSSATSSTNRRHQSNRTVPRTNGSSSWCDSRVQTNAGSRTGSSSSDDVELRRMGTGQSYGRVKRKALPVGSQHTVGRSSSSRSSNAFPPSAPSGQPPAYDRQDLPITAFLSNSGNAPGTTLSSEQAAILPPSYHRRHLDELHEEGDVGGTDASMLEAEGRVQTPAPLYTRSRYPITQIDPITGDFHSGGVI